MSAKFSPTLRQVFALSLLGLLLGLGLLFYLIFNGSERTILESSEQLRDRTSREMVNRVSDYLQEAPMAVADFERQIKYGLVDPAKVDSIHDGLMSLLLANQNISEASFTYATSPGLAPNKDILINHSSAGEVSVFNSGGRFVSRRTWFDGKQFLSQTTELQGSPRENPSRIHDAIPATDPTSHLTFTTPISHDWKGTLIWTDLHWSQLDQGLPENQRHVEVSVQKSVTDSQSRFAGVLRVGLMKEQIDNSVHVKTADSPKADPYLIFLCTNDGRLITGLGDNDRITEFGNDLGIARDNLPPPVLAALKLPALKTLGYGQTFATSFRSGGEIYLCTFKSFPQNNTQDWNVGVVVPRSFYLAQLERIRNRVLLASLGLIAAIIATGGYILHSIGRAHSMVVSEASRMNAFEFSASQNSSRLRDVNEVLASLEKAKTAMRAMGKYVPVDLVKRLYHDGREPVLGGESVDLSVMFTDIRGFTTFAEQNDPDKVAVILGRYLQVMASAIQGGKGTIDKFIGDAVMAFWNAPEQARDHSVLACRAALRCRASLRALYDSPEWKGAPEFETRYGLHRCAAYVGHFGAPDRFNYTAIGDGVNLASRLEGLNKQYGTAVIASESIYQSAREQFDFRLLDRVAVKGKALGITIYELLGTKENARPAAVENYEKAFAEFQRGEFKTALALLEREPHDPPGQALADRCRHFIGNPPGKEWNGVHVFESK